jgi:uncharacterized membrane protein YidH (DUF202 family)
METDPHRMIPIWFIIGINILVIGVIILVTGLVRWNASTAGVEMAQVHPDVWWGALMTAVGLVYTVKFRPGKS